MHGIVLATHNQHCTFPVIAAYARDSTAHSHSTLHSAHSQSLLLHIHGIVSATHDQCCTVPVAAAYAWNSLLASVGPQPHSLPSNKSWRCYTDGAVLPAYVNHRHHHHHSLLIRLQGSMKTRTNKKEKEKEEKRERNRTIHTLLCTSQLYA